MVPRVCVEACTKSCGWRLTCSWAAHIFRTKVPFESPKWGCLQGFDTCCLRTKYYNADVNFYSMRIAGAPEVLECSVLMGLFQAVVLIFDAKKEVLLRVSSNARRRCC